MEGGERIKLQIFLSILNVYVNSYKMKQERKFSIHSSRSSKCVNIVDLI